MNFSFNFRFVSTKVCVFLCDQQRLFLVMATNFEPPDSASLHVMLSQLQCPYDVEDQAMCSFYQHEAFCPFGHLSDHIPRAVIPPYICLDYLVGKCIAEDTWKIPVEDDWLTRCSTGYHPTWTQLFYLDELDRKVEVALQDEEAKDDELKCAICLEHMHSPFGLQEQCSHLFCGECIIEWEETDGQKRCPVCRVHTRRVLLWTDPNLNEQTKLELFALQARCIDLFPGDNQDRNQELREQELEEREHELQLRDQVLEERKRRFEAAVQAFKRYARAHKQVAKAREVVVRAKRRLDRAKKRLARYERMAERLRQAEEAKPKLFKMFERFLLLLKSCFRR